jgi:hypothetical protein
MTTDTQTQPMKSAEAQQKAFEADNLEEWADAVRYERRSSKSR